jgi:xanthine dehydrogenase accessory factor
VAIVIGCGDIGSAIAHALHNAGFAVVLADHVDPPWPRRGMTFTDAWYVGNAEVEGAMACFCASVRTIATLLAQRLIAATTWSWAGIAETLPPALVVDARTQTDRSPAVLLGSAMVTVGVGTGFLPGVHVDLAIDAHGTEPPYVDERLVARADRPGWFMTSHRIGARVHAGEVVGHLGRQAFVAPADGVLRGLSARGARVHPGVEVIEVDPNGNPASCFGLGQRQRLIAVNVVRALAAHETRYPGLVARTSQWGSAVSLIG